jgi:RNA polymerase sigma-70 factor (ECF subfamily)
VPLPIEPPTDTSPGFEPAAPRSTAEDAIFDREWAIALLDRALLTLAAELSSAGKGQHFTTLKPWLTGAPAPPAAEEAATRLGLTENALTVAIHRLRKRFRALVKAEIAQTVTSPEDQQAELRHLIDALAASEAQDR